MHEVQTSAHSEAINQSFLNLMKTPFTDRIRRLAAYPSYALYGMAHRYIKRYEGFNYNFQKNGEENFLDRLSHQDITVVFDVGANVGDWSEIALTKFHHATIHCFELSEATYRTLQAKLAHEKRVVLNNMGLSDNAEIVEYKDQGTNSRKNTLLSDISFHALDKQPIVRKAELSTGSEYCKSAGVEHIDLLKIDVEGVEHLVLKGFTDFLEKGKIKAIQFEYGYLNGDTKFLMKDFYRLLESYGYVLGPLKRQGVLFMDFDYALNNFKSGPNYVAIHKSCPEIISTVKGPQLMGFPRR